jgi:DNA-directed RNA polymerase subunit M/transcription elongation factor TFIIS
MQQIFCPSCGTNLAPTARFCGHCGNTVEAEKPVVKTSSTEPVTSKPVSHTQPVTEPIINEAAISTLNLKATSTEKLDPASPEAEAAMRRYQGAYRIARLTDIAGHLLKAVGLLMGISALVIVGFGVKTDYLEKGFVAVIALFFAGTVFLLFFAVGLMVSAQGQNLKANLDSAVNSSPFLTNEQRAKVMTL